MIKDEITKVTVDLNKAINQLVAEVNSEDFDKVSLLKSKLALSLVLISMSIKSIPRLINLFEFSQKAEERIFNKERLTDVADLSEMIELYKLSTERQTGTISFISGVLNALRWNDLENILLIISSQAKNAPELTSTSKRAQEIIQQISDLKTSGLIDQSKFSSTSSSKV